MEKVQFTVAASMFILHAANLNSSVSVSPVVSDSRDH